MSNPLPAGEITTLDLIKLIRDVFECIESLDEKSKPFVTIFSDEILMLELDDFRFRVEIKDMRRFQ